MSKPKTTTVSFEVTLPPDGWEASNRQPDVGEKCMLWDGRKWSHATVATTDDWCHPCTSPSVFAYPKIDKWNQHLEALNLADGWISVEGNETIWWQNEKPILSASRGIFVSKQGAEACLLNNYCLCAGLTIPKYEGDWKKSLRQIKNHKVVTP
jgi:hypothetical protein